MRKIPFLAITLALVLSACNNRSQQNQDIDSIDYTIKNSNKTIYDRLIEELDSTDVYNDSILYGYWFQPHAACVINIFFHKDNTYEFKYCENFKSDKVIDKIKKGHYAINGEVITLTSDDGWDSTFNGIMFYKHNGTNFYLTDKKDGFYLVKGSE